MNTGFYNVHFSTKSVWIRFQLYKQIQGTVIFIRMHINLTLYVTDAKEMLKLQKQIYDPI